MSNATKMVIFIMAYCLFLTPHYTPLFGCKFFGLGMVECLEATWTEIPFYLPLIAICFFRGKQIGKPWLVAFPLAAMGLDEFLNVFFIPSLIHAAAILLGSIGPTSPQANTTANPQANPQVDSQADTTAK